jgi:hypothetical protein
MESLRGLATATVEISKPVITASFFIFPPLENE